MANLVSNIVYFIAMIVFHCVNFLCFLLVFVFMCDFPSFFAAWFIKQKENIMLRLIKLRQWIPSSIPAAYLYISDCCGKWKKIHFIVQQSLIGSSFVSSWVSGGFFSTVAVLDACWAHFWNLEVEVCRLWGSGFFLFRIFFHATPEPWKWLYAFETGRACIT